MMRRRLGVILIFLGFTTSAFAAPPRPQVQRPVKLDQSGRPVYNPWEYQDEQRRGGSGRGAPRRLNSSDGTQQQRKPLNGVPQTAPTQTMPTAVTPTQTQSVPAYPGLGSTPTAHPYAPVTSSPNRQILPGAGQ